MFRIREAREAKKRTQEQLAKEVGVTREYISFIENGKYYPSVSLLKKIAEALNTNVRSLIVEKELPMNVTDNDFVKEPFPETLKAI